MTRTIDWVDGEIRLIDQTRLPDELVVLRVTTVDGLVDAISRLAVRGAPALGVAGAMGVALLARRPGRAGTPEAVRLDAAALRAARPTAVNLAWGVDRALARLDDGPDGVLAEALAVRDEDVAASAAMATRGADLVRSLVARPTIRAMTICNTGALAAVERGTALGVVGELHTRGILEEALPLETRPLLQGARLTAWELQQMGAPFRLLVDAAAASVLARGLADVVVIGADRVTANGDTANKVGSLSLALAARHAGVPFVVVAPESTLDLATPDGVAIEIEERGPAEVVGFRGIASAPAGTRTLNPAFDVTPASLITAIVTDRRVIDIASGETPAGNVGVSPTR
ncbi:MAG TPA: S-methyl-5-thioribose-1-phosphate isomerase [Candidatus Limnocylindrales bacterium]|nr:S-methyl-5-thioribose-1-phosphate isomerase [Candidatus Limnocylindrales bacterium]